jgi:hypothetical protein
VAGTIVKDDLAVLPLAGSVSPPPAVVAAVGDVRDLMHDDHQHLVTLSRDLAEAETSAARRALYAELRTLLDAHARAEEAVVYHAMLRLKGSKDSRDLGNEGIVEHGLVDHLLERLARTDLAGTDAWHAHAIVLHRVLQRHIDEEEDACFDALAEHFTDAQRASMGEAFARLRAQAPRVEVVVSD